MNNSILKIIIILLIAITGQNISAQRLIYTRNIRQKTHGSRYFFAHFERGFIISSKDSLIKHPGYLFNYDKISGDLLLKTDAKTLLAVNKADVKSFTLYDEHQNPFVFEKVESIDTSHFLQVLALGIKYKIYKLFSTTYIRADYQTNGFSSTGNKYDEFVDDGKYYILNISNNNLQKFSLKINSLKTAFSSDSDNLNKFMTLHPSDTINDIYLSSLGTFMNN